MTGYDISIPNAVGDSDGITALWAFGEEDELLVFTNTQTFVLAGNDHLDYTLTQLSRVMGCVSPTGVCETDAGIVVFVGNGNIYAFDGSRSVVIGDAIKNGLEGFNLSAAHCEYVPQWRSVVVAHWNGTYVWHLPSGLKSAFSTKAYWDIGGWTKLDVLIGAMVRYPAHGDSNEFVFAPADGVRAYKFNSGLNTDDGDDIQFFVQTKTYTLGPFMQAKESRQVWVLCNTSEEEPFDVQINRVSAFDGPLVKTATATVKIGGAMWDVDYWDEFVWADDAVGVAIADHGDGMIGHAFSVAVSSDDDKSLTVFGIGMSMKQKERV